MVHGLARARERIANLKLSDLKTFEEVMVKISVIFIEPCIKEDHFVRIKGK
jgi:hypothetical protein